MRKKTIFTYDSKSMAALCLLGLLSVSSPAAASEITLNLRGGIYVLNADQTTIKEVLDYIESKSKYVFVYDQNVKRRLGEKLSLSLKGKGVDDLLSELCSKARLHYAISGRQVTIKNLEPQQEGGAKTTKKVSGTIMDTNGEPLIGATVKIKDSNSGVITDIDGHYSIEVPEGSMLEISYVGMNPQQIKVGNRNNYDVEMVEDSNTLDELVVIGYGSVKKKDLTGAVAAVKGDELVNKRTTQLSSALQGSLSGVMVRRNSSAPGSGASSIHVRGVTTIGDSSPLVIVDGVEGSLDYVNPNDVESVSVLKDAAAASIYGSKAAAGVILVTTKRGNETGKIDLKYNAEFGWEIPTRQPSMVGVTRYLEMNNELQYNDNPSGGFFQVYTADQTKNWMRYHETDPNNYPVSDWKGLILKSSAPRMTHTLSVSGGNKVVRSVATLSYDDVDGLYDGRKFQRYMLRSNNDFKISDKLSATIDINIRYAKSMNQIYDPFSDMRKMPAIYPALWSDGRLASGKSGANPYGLLTKGGSSVNHSTQIGGKGSLVYKPFKGFSLSAIISPFVNYSKGKSFKMACGYYLQDDPETFGGYFDGGSMYATNKLSETRNDGWHVTSQLLANYMRDFGQNSLTLMAGFENYYSKSENLSAARDQYELTNYPYLNIGPEDYKDNSGSGSEYTSNSFFGRVLYSYANRYLFQANVRHDGSSRFAKKYRWGTFPSFSAGWVISEEPFMKGISPRALSYLKFRASWGKLGNERIGSNYFPYIALMSFGSSYFYMADGSVTSGKTARPAVLAVEDITWETTTSTDLGLDVNFFRNRLHLTFDYYWKKTSDMLLAIQIPYSMGYNDPSTNAGKMSTHGYDIDLGWQDHIGDFSYSISANFSDFLSKIDYLNNSDIISGGKIKRAGVLFNEYYGYICDGIYQTQEEVNFSARTSTSVTVGDLKYRDVTGPDGVPDGKISPEYDRVPLGNSLPRYQFGGQVNASWKGIDLSMAFQGVAKQNSYLDAAMVQPLRDNYGNIPSIIEDNYWSPFNTAKQNEDVFYPRLSSVSKSNNYATSTHWIFNGGYFRMKNITLGYTLPSIWIHKIGLNKLRTYISVSDLFCISDYPKGWDPEMGTSSYPITTSLVFGIQINF
ncbi:TonB-dependent receptor [Prevotella sp. KH2C16]|uniref:SusC/RagA family TonB-linked outer membrane protein n=1 Tax=Prevotella sp. KH2C16 TaxID=1855325 RepID=UPI0008EA9FA6|nr:TonB-dependent receptor [Prevotella sp. KH2C16]SFG25663.1 TonB-linked outer membrane protein, SusC/RagA family [Prevotella sp. KH2C16]